MILTAMAGTADGNTSARAKRPPFPRHFNIEGRYLYPAALRGRQTCDSEEEHQRKDDGSRRQESIIENDFVRPLFMLQISAIENMTSQTAGKRCTNFVAHCPNHIRVSFQLGVNFMHKFSDAPHTQSFKGTTKTFTQYATTMDIRSAKLRSPRLEA